MSRKSSNSLQVSLKGLTLSKSVKDQKNLECHLSELDQAHDRLRALSESVCQHRAQIVSEEDSKVQIITNILTNVLGWETTDISSERKHESGYSDYIMSMRGNPTFVVEAKRQGIFDIAVAEKAKFRTLRVSGPALKSAAPGVQQAFSYASEEGLPFAVLTDGFSWVVFKTHVPGKNYREVEAFVFPSLEAVFEDFSIFFDLLAKTQVAKRVYVQMFDELHNQRSAFERKLVCPFDESEIRIAQKSALAFDLDRVFDVYFGRMRGDDDPDLLIECFVETRESRVADFSLEKMTARVLGNINPAANDLDDHLEDIVRNSVDVDEGQTVFIVGPTGAGKTTFLDRFFRKTLSKSLRDRCVTVRVSCLDASGDQDSMVAWAIDRLIEEIEREVFDSGAATWDDLVGMYFREYRRRAEGTGAELYKSDKAAFKIEFGKFLEDRVENDREGYLKRLLADIVSNRAKLPILIIDNIDEFSFEQKTDIFQLAQALRRYAKHALVIFPITDKSAWAFSKSDIFGIYSSRSFFLPTPSPRDVFRKRIEYLRSKIDVFDTEADRKNYFTSKGIRVSIENLDGFAAVLEQVFVDHEFTSKTLGELCNYNIRRTLSLARRVMTSAVFSVDQLITTYVAGQPVSIGYLKFTNALLKGDYAIFRQSDQHEVFPIFQIDKSYQESPLLALRILYFLEAVALTERNIEDKHVSVQSIIDYFDVLGCSEAACLSVLNRLFLARLIEPYDVSVPNVASGQKLAITFSGKAHVQLATTNRAFFSQMALTTSITDESKADEISQAYLSKSPSKDRHDTIRKTFADYLLIEDAQHLQHTTSSSAYQGQSELIGFIRRLGAADNKTKGGATDIISISKRNVVGVVDWFDAKKGFGFVEIGGVSGGVFVHIETVKSSGLDVLNDGDDIVCDIGSSSKGLSVQKIHTIRTDPTEIDIVKAQVIRVFHDRRYGFVQIENSDRTAFFHFSVLSTSDLKMMEVGLRIKVELKMDKGGTATQVRRILKVYEAKN
ncbi:cold shock domain-containing protein [Tropicibacter sp. S64]|uniref:cold shock domain-containing protein n=1 Tax=Tropicibacter sp. S64 TaxID=3415122 RepID=UPI003C7D0AB0